MDLNNSCEPMDVDLSSNSVNAMEISYSEDISVNEEIKKEKNDFETDFILSSTPFPKRRDSFKKKNKIKLTGTIRKKQFKSNTSNVFYISGTVILLSVILYYINLNFKCYGNLDTQVIRKKLFNRIYGQEIAVSRLITSLETDVNNKIVVLYGPTGVGKTLAVSLIIENLLTYSNIYHFTMPTCVDIISKDLLIGMTLCGNSIFIIDDLKNNDTVQIKEIVKNLVTKSKSFSNHITIILVYNCALKNYEFLPSCSSTFNSDLSESYKDVDAFKEYIEFKALDDKSLRKCIEYELGNVKISDEMFMNIKKNFNVSQDGCKSVYQKVKYLNLK